MAEEWRDGEGGKEEWAGGGEEKREGAENKLSELLILIRISVIVKPEELTKRSTA